MNEGVNEGVRDGRMNIGFSISSFWGTAFLRENYTSWYRTHLTIIKLANKNDLSNMNRNTGIRSWFTPVKKYSMGTYKDLLLGRDLLNLKLSPFSTLTNLGIACSFCSLKSPNSYLFPTLRLASDIDVFSVFSDPSWETRRSWCRWVWRWRRWPTPMWRRCRKSRRWLRHPSRRSIRLNI